MLAAGVRIVTRGGTLTADGSAARGEIGNRAAAAASGDALAVTALDPAV